MCLCALIASPRIFFFRCASVTDWINIFLICPPGWKFTITFYHFFNWTFRILLTFQLAELCRWQSLYQSCLPLGETFYRFLYVFFVLAYFIFKTGVMSRGYWCFRPILCWSHNLAPLVYLFTQSSCRDMKTISNKFHQRALSIKIFGDFCRHSIKT